MLNENYINRCLLWMMGELADLYANDNIELPENFNTKIDTFYNCISTAIDWENLSIEDLRRLGFLNWDMDNKDSVWFIPSWLEPIIPEGLLVYDKDGREFEFNSEEAPINVMYGCLTFGVKPCK